MLGRVSALIFTELTAKLYLEKNNLLSRLRISLVGRFWRRWKTDGEQKCSLSILGQLGVFRFRALYGISLKSNHSFRNSNSGLAKSASKIGCPTKLFPNAKKGEIEHVRREKDKIREAKGHVLYRLGEELGSTALFKRQQRFSLRRWHQWGANLANSSQ